MQITVVNQNSQVAYFRFGGFATPAPTGTYNGTPLDGTASLAIPANGSLTGIDLTQFVGGKVLFSLGAPVQALPDFQYQAAGPDVGTPWDKLELSLFSDPAQVSVLNMTSTDFYGFDMTVQTYAQPGDTTALTTLSFSAPTTTLLGQLATLSNNNPYAVVTGPNGVLVNGVDVLRVISPSTVPPSQTSAYPSFQPYITAEIGSTTEVKGLYSQAGTTTETMTQDYDFQASILADGSVHMTGGGSPNVTGGPSVGAGWTIDIAAAGLSNDIYLVNPVYTLTNPSGTATTVTDNPNNVFGAAIRDYLSGFDYGFVGSTALDPNTGVALGLESTDHWYGTGDPVNTGTHTPLGSAHAFAYAQPTQTFYNQYAADIAQVSDSYGFPYTDLIGAPLADINPNNVQAITITLSAVACFAEGTRIGTPTGETAVEHLAVGDLIKTRDGVAPVRFVGRTHCRRARPIRVEAGSFGPGAPSRDLVLSPEHAIFVAGSLVPIHCLVDGIRITELAARSITYFHVLLDRHDVILAESLPTESLRCDADEGLVFDNAHEAPPLQTNMLPCAPRITQGPQLEQIRRSLRHSPASAVAPESDVSRAADLPPSVENIRLPLFVLAPIPQSLDPKPVPLIEGAGPCVYLEAI